LRNGFAQSFGFTNTAEIKGLPIIKFGRNQRNVIMIVHPFWNMKDFKEANWLAEIYYEITEHTESNGGKISIIDSFNLHRRPGWCYEKLIQRGRKKLQKFNSNKSNVCRQHNVNQ